MKKPHPVDARVEHESRICFGISWFRTEAEAREYAEYVREQGWTYNGGYFHGMPCGRAPSWDKDHPVHGRIYAVTD